MSKRSEDDDIDIIVPSEEGPSLEAIGSEGGAADEGGMPRCAAPRLALIKNLVDRHPIILTFIDNKGKTPLMLAVEAHNYDAMQILCTATRGCGINAQDNNGDTALHIATRLHDETAIYHLAEYIACTTIVNYAGEMATDIAQRYDDWSDYTQRYWEVCLADTESELSDSDDAEIPSAEIALQGNVDEDYIGMDVL